jgi:hypothetical protein
VVEDPKVACPTGIRDAVKDPLMRRAEYMPMGRIAATVGNGRDDEGEADRHGAQQQTLRSRNPVDGEGE